VTGDEIPTQQADAGFDAVYCPGDPILLNGSNPLPGTGVWSTVDELVIFDEETDLGTAILGLPSGMYTVTWTLSYASCIDYSSDEVTISVLFPPLTLPDTVEVPFGQTKEFVVTLNDTLYQAPFTLTIIMNPQRGNALHAGNGIMRYTPNVGFVGTDMLVYRICSTDCPDECSESVVILRVGNEDDCFIPTLFTPNNDGINDRLIIPCLETSRYPNNKVIVFNEWGDAVFTASPYLNDWEGTIKGNSLPVGTYFYIMDFGDGSTPRRSFLILER
jgi:gliding motility-associated-like protein